ncbi:hypothetical protein [Lysinibacillus sp. TE18511]
MAKLKAGDFVKYNDNQMGITAGKLYKVYEKYGELSITDDDDDWRHGGVFSDEHEILSAEEVKWAKIGRKVNEFKKGDVIEITRDQCGSKVGTVTTVVSIINGGEGVTYKGDHARYGADVTAIKLVAPVESLFKN